MSGEPWYTKPGGVLSVEKHSQLVANRMSIAADAGIPVELLWQPLPALSEGEKEWLVKFRQHRQAGYSGLLLTGVAPKLDPLSRMGAFAGCLARNLIRARVFPLLKVLGAVSDNVPITATCLLIPDFIPHKQTGKETPAWRIQQLTTLLTDRWSTSKVQTVIYAPSMEDIVAEHGSFVGSLIKSHYLQIAVK